jgi:predicted metalloprotease with PDZ domain
MMPVWTPGHYAVEDFSKNVLDVSARALHRGDWLEAEVEKESKNVWRVEWGGSTGTIEVQYSVYAFEYRDTASYLDSIHAIVNGASLFIYPVGMEDHGFRLVLVPRRGWSEVATGLDQTAKWTFVAPNLDVLIDSPIEVGNQEIRSFTVQGIEHLVSLFGEAPVDRAKLVEDIRRIVEKEMSVFGQIPYRKYVFLVNFTDESSGGLEHLNSTVCFVPRLRLIPREEYNLMLGLFSHEFFHTWNVKRMRPKGLGPFNYGAETYTKSLWIAEGITSYYDDLILRRTGAYTVPEYLDAFAFNIDQLKSLPGSRMQSAQEASFDTWIKYYKTNANSPNVTASYYHQGAVIGWMLDLQIRENTGGRRSLDDVMRRVYEETYAKGGGSYTDEQFEAITLDVGGQRGLRAIFDTRVKGRGDIDYDRYLGYVGLKLEPKEKQNRARGFLGIRLGTEGGRAVVKGRLTGSPAEAMGLAVNDEILGIDGFRLGPEKLPYYVSNGKPGQRIELLGARNGLVLELAGQLGSRPPFEYRILPGKEATKRQKILFRNWLLEEWKPEQKYPEYPKSPDRRSTLDYI